MRPNTAPTRLATMLLQLLPLFAAEAATITVGTTSDSDVADGFCALREAILAANSDAAHNDCPAGSGADRIVFALTLPAVINVLSDLPAVTDTVAIRGPGADQLAIDGQTLHRLFNLTSTAGGKWYLLEDLSVQHGYANTGLGPDGGGVYLGPGDTALLSRLVVAENVAANGGGGIAVDSTTSLLATAEIIDCQVSANFALGATGGGGLLVLDGSTVTVDRSSLVDNQALALHGGGGGILDQRSTVTVLRSTISSNAANESGGGVFLSAAGSATAVTVSLIDSTVYANLADANGDLAGDGGGIFTCCAGSASLTVGLQNSIVAGNLDDGALVYPDLSGGTGVAWISSGFNLIGANDGASTEFPTGSPNANGDFVGTFAAPLDPLLQALDLNQGTTLSHRPLVDAASLVIDHGACPGSDGDQRGHGAPAFDRRALDHPAVPTDPASDGCDIGAVERGGLANSSALLFVDGFELGHTLLWTAETP